MRRDDFSGSEFVVYTVVKRVGLTKQKLAKARASLDNSNPVKPIPVKSRPDLRFEYTYEIACSDESFRQSVGCHFELAKTEQEALIGDWQVQRSANGTQYTVFSAVDEPKKIVAKVAMRVMGISLPQSVKLHPIGAGIVNEAFIPVTPSVQLGERLGLPTEGYYYHFFNGRLIQEYKLLGDGKWLFYATRSTHEQLNDEQGCNRHQSAILVYWKIGGVEAKGQHLVYLKQQITRKELDSLNDEWLAKHGVLLEVKELLRASKQTESKLANRQVVQQVVEQKSSKVHTVIADINTHQRESWPEIAQQYGLSAKQLLDLNPRYHSNPMGLKVGDRLTVQLPTPNQTVGAVLCEAPLQKPSKYNQASHAFYACGGTFQGTSIKPITSRGVLNSELTVVNLSHASPLDIDDFHTKYR